MRKKIIIVTLVYLIIFLIGFNEKEKRENLLVCAFEESEFIPMQTNINSFGKLNKVIGSFEEMKLKIDDILKFFEIEGNIDVKKNESDSTKEYSVTKYSKDAKINIKIETVKGEQKQLKESYLVIDIVLYRYFEDIPNLKQKIDKVFEENEIKSTVNITMAGSYNGKLTDTEKQKVCSDIMQTMKAKVKDKFETDKIYSLYAYTNMVRENIKSGKNIVNVNLAIRYNSYENKTYLYLATPIITVDY